MNRLSPPTMDLTHPTWPTSLTLVWTVIVVCHISISLCTNLILTIIDNRADRTGVDAKHLGTAKDYGTGTGTTATGTTSSTTGPHKSSIMNKLDPRVDSDTSRAVPSSVTHGTESGIAGAGTAHTGTTRSGTHGLGGTTTGTHSSTVGSGTHGTTQPLTGATGTTTHGSSSTNAGPHSSNIANKADPRVDSDRDHRARHETATGAGTGFGTAHSTSTNAGPHDSNIVNKLDPRVDSDRDNRAHHEPLTGAGHGTTHGIGTTHGTSTNAGPHDSNIANKADPRVDSDRDNRALLAGAGTAPALGSTHGTRGPTSTLGSSTGTGHAQPLTGGNTHGTHGPTSTLGSSTGTGHAQPLTGGTTHGTSTSTTAGPHNSNIANKLDPRVDSDLGNRAAHQSLSGTGVGSTTHGTHTRDTGAGIGSHGLAGSSYNTPAGTAGRTSGTTATAGPHDSSIANKLDPRVESDVTGTQRTI